MWGWFSERKPAVEEIPAPPLSDDVITCHDLTISELVDLAAHMPWEDWTTFIVLTRNHNIDYMTKESVTALFEQYRQCRTNEIPPEPCSPRQLAEFLYLLPPPRWFLFQQFAASTNINSMSFTNLMVAFFMFENTVTAANGHSFQ